MTQVFANDVAQLKQVFDDYNKCTTKQCALRFLDGLMLKQLSSVKEVKKVDNILRSNSLSAYKSESKIMGDYGALYVSDYRHSESTTTEGGVAFAYLFHKKNSEWKIYHRLPVDEVGPDLKPLSRP